MIQLYYPITFFALVPDAERKMWTLAKGTTRKDGVFMADGKSDLKRQLDKEHWGFVANILVPDRHTFEGFDKEGKLQESRRTSLYWAGVWQCPETKKTLIAMADPDILRSQCGESLCERGAWGTPTGYNFSHLCALKDMEWYDIELYAKPKAAKESEAGK